MQTKILHNPTSYMSEDVHGNQIEVSGSDIKDYPIEEAAVNSMGEIIMDKTLHKPKWTGNTLEWTILKGETKEFPAYVADYLCYIYSFLQVAKKPLDEESEKVDSVEVKDKAEVEDKAEVKEAKSKPISPVLETKNGKLKCPYCDQLFTSRGRLGVHIGAKHLEKVLPNA